MSNTTTPTLGPRTPKPETASRMRAIAQANYDVAKLTTTPILVAELRAHGSFVRACATVGTNQSTLWDWRRRDAELNRDVLLAVKFAASDAVDYAAWVVAR